MILHLTNSGNQKEAENFISEEMSATAIPTSLSVGSLPAKVRSYVEKWAERCTPSSVHVCDGSAEEDKALHQLLMRQGSIIPLSKLDNW